MLKTITMLNEKGEETKVPFMATARTPRRYKQVFGRDLFRDCLVLSEGAENAATEGAENADELLDFVERLAFIMATQASGADFKGICADVDAAMGDWLDTLDSAALAAGAEEIIGVYLDNKRTGSKAKKK